MAIQFTNQIIRITNNVHFNGQSTLAVLHNGVPPAYIDFNGNKIPNNVIFYTEPTPYSYVYDPVFECALYGVSVVNNNFCALDRNTPDQFVTGTFNTEGQVTTLTHFYYVDAARDNRNTMTMMNDVAFPNNFLYFYMDDYGVTRLSRINSSGILQEDYPPNSATLTLPSSRKSPLFYANDIAVLTIRGGFGIPRYIAYRLSTKLEAVDFYIDGSAYGAQSLDKRYIMVYKFDTATSIQIRVVDTLNPQYIGVDTTRPFTSDIVAAYVIDTTKALFYTPEGLWLVNPSTGQFTQISTIGAVYTLTDSAFVSPSLIELAPNVYQFFVGEQSTGNIEINFVDLNDMVHYTIGNVTLQFSDGTKPNFFSLAYSDYCKNFVGFAWHTNETDYFTLKTLL